VSGLDRLAAAQDRALARLREGSPDRELLVQLLENSCLLELAKLDAELDLASSVQLAADIITAMFPVSGCEIEFATDDDRPWVVTSGAPVVRELVRFEAPIIIGGRAAGELRLGALNAELDAADFVVAAAARLAAVFDRALAAERLRRAAASATAARLAAELDDDAPADTLEAIVVQLAAFPGAHGAELLVDHPAVGAPLTVRAGTDDQPEPVVASRALPGSGVLSARMSMQPGAPAVAGALDDVLDRIVGSLERIAREQQLRREVETDPLTGLGNRRRLDRALLLALARARRYGEHVTVLLLDLDGFKAVNDTLGHEAGDRVLQNVARAARRVTRGYDEVVRLGGDELVVVSPATELLGALTLAESLRVALAEAANAHLPADLRITVSVGLAIFPDSADSGDELLRAADGALYAAKAAGKDRVAVAPVAGLDGRGVIEAAAVGALGSGSTNAGDGGAELSSTSRRWWRGRR
jgi:diguanylate cyclase (GGDEF)-like protein